MSSAHDPSRRSSESSQACGSETAQTKIQNENEMTISVISKRFWSGKNTVRVSDMETVHAELIKLEEGINRSFRLLNRSLNQKVMWVSQVVTSANANFETLKIQLESLAERFDEFDKANDGTEVTSVSRANDPDLTNDADVSTFQTPRNQMIDNANGEDNNGEDETVVWGVNMLSSNLSIGSSLEVFGEESVFAFDDWAERFRDFVSVSGKNWSKEEKVTRLKLSLKDTSRALFKELQPQQIVTVDTAMDALRAKLDSPQRREIAKRTLSICKQREDETVAQFLRRLTPLVEATNPSLTGDQRKEKVCEEFLDRLKPNVGFLIRLVGLTQARNLEMVKGQAQELEALLIANKGDDTTRLSQLISALREQSGPSQPNVGTGASQSNTGAWQRNSRDTERQQPNNTWGFRPFNNQDVQHQQFSNQDRGNARRWGKRQQESLSQRNWSNRPTCYFCHKVGHLAYSCNARKAQFSNSRNGQAEWNHRPQQQQTRVHWQDQSERVNMMQPSSSSSTAPGFMEELVKSLINMNIKNSFGRSGAENDSQKPGSMNSIIQIKPKVANDSKIKNEVKRESSASDSACGQKTIKAPRPKTSNWESSTIGKLSSGLLVTIMIITSMCALINPVQTSRPDHPVICQTQAEGKIWQLPEVVGCSKMIVDPIKPLVSRTLEIFTRNEFLHSIDAWACRRVSKAIRKYTSITNVPMQEILEPVSNEMSTEECRQMIDHGKCSLGILINESGLQHTDNKIDISPKMWFVGSFSWTVVQSENCYLFRTKVTVRHGDENIQTSLGTPSGCSIKEAHCVLPDKTIVIWEANVSRNCEYQSIGTWNGLQLDDIWVSDEASFRLSFRSDANKVYSCGIGLELTHEGFAVKDTPDPEKENLRRIGGESRRKTGKRGKPRDNGCRKRGKQWKKLGLRATDRYKT